MIHLEKFPRIPSSDKGHSVPPFAQKEKNRSEIWYVHRLSLDVYRRKGLTKLPLGKGTGVRENILQKFF